MGFGSPPGLSKIQSMIAGVKTPRIETFFILLERSWSVDVQNGLAWAIWNLQHKLWSKEGSGVKLPVWLPITKSRESTRFRCVQVECNTPLESSRGELQLWFRPRPNWSLRWEVMNAQSPGSSNRDNFGTPLWEFREKKPFGCKCSRELQIILYGGRWWLPLSPSRDESSESKVAYGLSQHWKCAEWILSNLLVGFGCKTE
jgi:hypothetical protein